jgi:hypothetical protein
MRFAKILSVAAVPMILLACGEDSTGMSSNPSQSQDPAEQPKDSIKENTPDSLLKPIERDFTQFWQGEGTAVKPFLISNEEDLLKIAFYVNDSSMTFKDVFFKQTADISLTKAWKPIGIFGQNANGWGNRPFSGTFDGDAKTISGMTISDTAAYSGLFGLVRGAHISNVIVSGAKMNVGSIGGALAGLADSVIIENCTVENAEVKGADRVAGLIGEAKNVTVTNASVTGSVTGTSNVGGIFGSVLKGTQTNLTNKATVSGKSSVGGVVGESVGECVGEKCDFSIITLAFNYGAVTGTKDVGGVVAKMSTTKMTQSGNNGAVTASESQIGAVGGVVAVALNKSSINEVFNTGTVTGTKVQAVGGAIGNMKSITATNVFNVGEVAGDASSPKGGIVGIVDGTSDLSFAYNAGKVPQDNNAGTVAGKIISTATVANVYFDKTVGDGSKVYGGEPFGVETPTGFATEEMKSSTFVATLNGTGRVWTIDPAKFGGYPSFEWAK